MSAVPEIRFPEFDGEWTNDRLANLIQKGRKITYGIVQPGTFVADGVVLVRGGDYSGGWSDLSEFRRVTPEIDGPYKRSRLESGDLLLTIVGANTGTVAIVPDWLSGANITQTTARVAIEPKRASPGFIFHFLRTSRGKNEVYRYIKGAAQPGLNLADVEKFLFPLPTLPEQQKVATFLGAVDNKIDALRRKHDALKQFKAGLMQKLFSQELRFQRDDGPDYPDWEEKRLGKIADIVGGGTPETARPEYWNGDVDWFTPTEIKSKYAYGSRRRISEKGLRNSSAKVLPAGTLLLCTRATVGTISIAARPCTTNQGFQSLIIRKPHVNEFWYYWVVQNKKEFIRRASGSTFLEIGKTEVGKLPVLTPHPDEQKKIADCLAAMDSKIEAVAGQIAHVESFKAGLLQKMFV